MEKRKVIIDCDPGIDDAYALVLALREPSLEVLGIHTVSGNVSVAHTTRNTRGLLYLLDSDVPIHVGYNQPLAVEPRFAADVHGHNGFAGYEFSDDQLKPISHLTSLQAYYEVLSKTEDKITIIAIGPLTNVAMLIKAYPELIHKIDSISIMGGGLKGGNITVAGEFNFYVDPHAAKIVFESGIPIIMAGLDVTEKARFFKEDVEAVKASAGKVGALLHEISQPGLEAGIGMGVGASIAPNDTVSVLVLTNPELFQGQDYEVSIVTEGEARGMSLADTRVRAKPVINTHVLLEVNQVEFRKTLIEKLKGA